MISCSITRSLFTLKRMKLVKELDKTIKNLSKTDLSQLSDHCLAVQEAGFEVVFQESSSNISLKKEIEGKNVRLDFMPHEVDELQGDFVEELTDQTHKEKILKLKRRGKNVFLHPFKFWIFGATQTQVYFCMNGFGDCIVSTSFIVDNQELQEHGEMAFHTKFKPWFHILNEKFHEEAFTKYFEQLGIDRMFLEHVAKISEFQYKALTLNWLKTVKDFINT